MPKLICITVFCLILFSSRYQSDSAAELSVSESSQHLDDLALLERQLLVGSVRVGGHGQGVIVK